MERNTKHISINALATKEFRKVRGVSDERKAGDGFFIFLKPGYSFGAGTHEINDNTILGAIRKLKKTKHCNCQDCRLNQGLF